MNYISTNKLLFFIESYIRTALYDLNVAQLQGKFKEESFYNGQIFALEKLSKLLNLNIDVDKLKL